VKRSNAEAGAARYVPRQPSLERLRRAAARCEGCDLYKHATQTVFGEGPARARVMLVGEQPGDVEDKAGHPFVGPAGRLLHEAMHAAGLTRGVYVTNAVKHFKYVWRGKRRIHAKPKRLEIQACRPWLDAEIETIRPRVIVALGATAAQSMLGPAFRLSHHRGKFMASPWPCRVLATIHPSAILRAPDEAAREQAMAGFLRDLKLAARAAQRRT
jgi:uracil-DNA glycosylase family protein